MNRASISKFDPSNMRRLLMQFPQQITDALEIGKKADIPFALAGVKNVVLTGLGGSAIGGDLLRSYLAEQMSIPFMVNRHYFLPEFVDTSSLVIVSSYSGNTEETIAAHKDAARRGARVLCISTNGETEKLAKGYGHPLIKIPPGLPPRAALGYSFFPILMALRRLGAINVKDSEIRETVTLLKKKGTAYADASSKKNPALRLASELYGKLVVVYSAADRFDVVNLRWRGQFAENSKVLAFGHVIPEMNHNELVGWNVLKNQMKNLAVVFLRDGKDYRRVQLRMEINKSIIAKYTDHLIEVHSEGKSLLARMFSLIHLGDWTSFYLAILNGVDPTPVRVIDYLKSELAKAT